MASVRTVLDGWMVTDGGLRESDGGWGITNGNSTVTQAVPGGSPSKKFGMSPKNAQGVGWRGACACVRPSPPSPPSPFGGTLAACGPIMPLVLETPTTHPPP